MGRRPGDRLGFLGVVGAWLRVWTPPRDAVVPSVPWRALAIGGVLLLAVLGAAAAFALPRLADDRTAAREREQRAEVQRRAAFLASVDREQRPRRGRARRDPGASATPRRRTATRKALLASAEAGIARDARNRTGRRIRGVDCDPFPRTPEATVPAEELSRRAAAYDCVAVTARFRTGTEGIIGIPFRLAVDFASGRYAWCRIVPLADRDRLSRLLPRACRL